MKKKRSPKEIIEEVSRRTKSENIFLKFKGKELIPAIDYSNSNLTHTQIDFFKVRKVLKDNKGINFTMGVAIGI